MLREQSWWIQMSNDEKQSALAVLEWTPAQLLSMLGPSPPVLNRTRQAGIGSKFQDLQWNCIPIAPALGRACS